MSSNSFETWDAAKRWRVVVDHQTAPVGQILRAADGFRKRCLALRGSGDGSLFAASMV